MIILFIFGIFISEGYTQELDEKCNVSTKCMLLTECSPLLKLRINSTPEDVQTLRNAFCGFDQQSIKVCCPLAASSGFEEPPRRAGLQSTYTKEENDYFPKRCGIPGGIVTDRIVGGVKVPLGSYPWMAAFDYIDGDKKSEGRRVLCSGSVINERYILTAAHCFDPKDIANYTLVNIRLGEGYLSSDPDCINNRIGTFCSAPVLNVGFESITSHPQYDIKFRYANDIALIRLNTSINFTHDIQPICLPPPQLDITRAVGDRSLILAGWGHTYVETKQASEYLMGVSLPLQDGDVCRKIYPGQFENNQLCVGGEEGKDSCTGDSGSPLFVAGPTSPPFLQLGITSFGPTQCGLKNVPAVYTSVKHHYNWIKDTMKPW